MEPNVVEMNNRKRSPCVPDGGGDEWDYNRKWGDATVKRTKIKTKRISSQSKVKDKDKDKDGNQDGDQWNHDRKRGGATARRKETKLKLRRSKVKDKQRRRRHGVKTGIETRIMTADATQH